MEMLKRLGVLPLGEIEERMQDVSAIKTKIAGVLIKKQVRIAKSGNKFAFLQISDPTGVQEIMIFSELLATHQNILEAGTNLLIDLEIKQQDDSVRMSGQGIKLLDEALKDKSRLTYIHMKNAENLKQLRELLTADGHGLAVIHLVLPTDERHEFVEMKLNGAYKLSASCVNAIQQLQSVESLRDV
jgi:DNA polymerase-3 subunit alpha